MAHPVYNKLASSFEVLLTFEICAFKTELPCILSPINRFSSSAPTVRKKEHYTCAKCLYKTYRKDLLAKHVSKHMTIHGENSRRRRYYCGLCNKPSMAKGNMRMHILYKHSGKEKVNKLN